MPSSHVPTGSGPCLHDHEVGQRLGGHWLGGQREQFGAKTEALGQPVVAEALGVSAVDGDGEDIRVGQQPGDVHGLGRGWIAALRFRALELERQRGEQPATQQLLAGRQPGERLLDRADKFVIVPAVLVGLPQHRRIKRGDDAAEQGRVLERLGRAVTVAPVGTSPR